MYFTKEQREQYRQIARGVKPFGSSDKGIGKAIDDFQITVDTLKSALKDKIMTLPDNPRINRLGDNAFTVKASELVGNPWSPFFHDFKAQYKKLIKWIDELTPDEMLLIIGLIIKDGVVHRDRQQYRFHPDVIGYLKNLE